MGTICAPLVADLFCIVMRETPCCLFLTIIKQMWLKHLTLPQDIKITCFINNIVSPYFEQMVSQTYPTELQSNKANSSDTEVPVLDLDLDFTNSIVSIKIYDKRDDFNFEIVNFPSLDGDVHRFSSYGV